MLVAARVNHEESESKTRRRKRTCQSIVTFAPRPGSPNDDAGYTTKGGWLCPAHRQIEFTSEEKLALAEAITKAAVSIARCWDVLLKTSERIGRDWEPVDTCVSDIADYCASSIDHSAATKSLDPDLVAQCFSDPENWTQQPEEPQQQKPWVPWRQRFNTGR